MFNFLVFQIIMEKLSHIICLGGGNAMPQAVLEGLKKYPVRISAISAMLDSGGFAGREKELFKTLGKEREPVKVEF